MPVSFLRETRERAVCESLQTMIAKSLMKNMTIARILCAVFVLGAGVNLPRRRSLPPVFS